MQRKKIHRNYKQVQFFKRETGLLRSIIIMTMCDLFWSFHSCLHPFIPFLFIEKWDQCHNIFHARDRHIFYHIISVISCMRRAIILWWNNSRFFNGIVKIFPPTIRKKNFNCYNLCFNLVQLSSSTENFHYSSCYSHRLKI